MRNHPSKTFRQVFSQSATGLPGVVTLGRYHYAASRRGLFAHSHQDAVEICFLERGEQAYRVNGVIYRLSGNDQFVTFPGEIHDTAGLPEQPGTLFWVILKLKPLRHFLGLSPGPAKQLAGELLQMPNRHFRAHPDSGRILGELVGLLSERNNPPSTPTYRKIRIHALLLHYLTLTIQASRLGQKGAASPLVGRVLQYLDEHLEDPVQISRLAGVARLSESRFKTRFKREVGVPPADFWLRKKIERATTLLRTQNVTRTAYQLGFSSSQYFATVFKRYMLASPSHFLSGRKKSR